MVLMIVLKYLAGQFFFLTVQISCCERLRPEDVSAVKGSRAPPPPGSGAPGPPKQKTKTDRFLTVTCAAGEILKARGPN